jgi:hypothetical protein
MLRTTIFVLCLGAALLGLAADASAKRVAFVIGIDQYDNLEPRQQLKKAVGDASAVGETFKTLGYDVIETNNVSRLDFLRQWQGFLNRIEPGDEVGFYFAGHGVEIGGLNFLLPRDVPRIASGEEEVLKASALSFSSLLEQVRDRNPRMSLYIIDACRDNPFVDGRGRSIGGTRGLTLVKPPSGTFIMFSAGAGETALDRLSESDPNPNSIYTRTLLPLLKSPGVITDIARKVRRDVRDLASTANHVQTPAYYDEVIGEFCLAGCKQKVAAQTPKATPRPHPVAPKSSSDSAAKGGNPPPSAEEKTQLATKTPPSAGPAIEGGPRPARQP